MHPSADDDGLSKFVSARPRLFGIAYRVLGSAAEAEDVVQEVWLRWQRADRGSVENPAAFLATATTRMAINVARSARARRQTCVGPFPPESAVNDVPLGLEREQALKAAVLLLLEKLTPSERAAYVLREAFSYPYPRIAQILRVNVVNCRQLVTRARKHIREGRRAVVSKGEQRRLLEALMNAACAGDAGGLEALLASDVSPAVSRCTVLPSNMLCFSRAA